MWDNQNKVHMMQHSTNTLLYQPLLQGSTFAQNMYASAKIAVTSINKPNALQGVGGWFEVASVGERVLIMFESWRRDASGVRFEVRWFDYYRGGLG